METKKQEIINELKELKKMIEYMETMTEENENYKPLDKTEIELLEKKQTSNCIKDAHLYIIAEKIKKLAQQNKSKFKTNFKTIVAKDKITVNCVEDLKPFNAITLNTSVEPPQIESTIYDTSNLNEDKINAENKITKLLETRQDMTDKLKQEEINLEKMKKHKENFTPYGSLKQSIIDKQEIRINIIKYQIKELEEKIYENEQLIIKIGELELLSEKMDFNDFKKLRKILEETLGIDTKNAKGPVIEQTKLESKSRIYTIGNKYKVKYIQKTKKLN